MRFECTEKYHKDEQSPKMQKAFNTLCLPKLHKCMNSGREQHRRFGSSKDGAFGFWIHGLALQFGH